ncbi:MAG: hypothetical protein A4E23_01780 [Methanomethylovorans sp. PtaU1.Bin073]|nr:MAG: hypothetical protein A4E23_01780 [Methanomethylovorans sp. PtaU1.Bin073]
MGPPEQAPQASLRASGVMMDGENAIKLEHQGGDAVYLDATHTKVLIDGTTATTVLANADTEAFDAGEFVYLFNVSGVYYIDTLNTTDTKDPLATSGDSVNVKIVDVSSQQMIADLQVNF